MKIIELRKNVYLIENFWSSQKCQEFIRKTESLDYEPATIQTDGGPRLVDFIRNNNRVIYKDDKLALELWKELKDKAPQGDRRVSCIWIE